MRRPSSIATPSAITIDAAIPIPISHDVRQADPRTISAGIARPMLQWLNCDDSCAVNVSRRSAVSPR